MTEQTDNTANRSAWLDTVWLVAAAALLLGGLVAFYRLSAQPMPLRALAMLVGFGLSVGAFALSAPGRRVCGLLPCLLAVTYRLRPRLAGQEGIEPPTCGFGDRRSAN